MSRESTSIVTSVPTNRKPRTRIHVGPVDHLSSSQHGRLTPNFIKMIYPGDTFNMNDFAGFAYADKSYKLPLNDIIYDQFFFFVPFRIIDRKNWDKVLGFKENPLDTRVYEVPQFSYSVTKASSNTTLTESLEKKLSSVCPHLLPTFLGYNLPDYVVNSSNILQDLIFAGSAYPLMAYWTIWNEFFRDENLDSVIDLASALVGISSASDLGSYLVNNSSSEGISYLESKHLIPERVNKLHDPMTSGMISPQKSPDGQPVTLFLGGAAPVYMQTGTTIYTGVGPLGTNLSSDDADGSVKLDKAGGKLVLIDDGNSVPVGLYTDLAEATAVDINALRLAFSIQSLYEAKGRFGSRYIEYIRGIWSVEVPDSMLDRPEYLGGCRLSMNNMPVLNTASNLGLFSGYSATLFNGCQFDKTFLEYGFIIGVHCERVRHIYPQGRDTDIWDKLVELDFYNPKFAELGFMGYKKDIIWSGDNSLFNYNEAWLFERTQLSRASGIFGSLGGTTYQEYREKWLYADYYEEAPTFNSLWLKEPTQNVARTMTGELITNASDPVIGFQYMFDFKFDYNITRIIPVFSSPADLGGRW